MKKYLVFVNGQSYLVQADRISMEPSGVITMFQKDDATTVLPHGAAVIQEDTIIKPEAPSIVKPMSSIN